MKTKLKRLKKKIKPNKKNPGQKPRKNLMKTKFCSVSGNFVRFCCCCCCSCCEKKRLNWLCFKRKYEIRICFMDFKKLSAIIFKNLHGYYKFS